MRGTALATGAPEVAVGGVCVCVFMCVFVTLHVPTQEAAFPIAPSPPTAATAATAAGDAIPAQLPALLANMSPHRLCELHAHTAGAGVHDAAATDPGSDGNQGAAGGADAGHLWAKLPEDLQGMIVARVFAPTAAADDPPPLAARRLAAVSKGFAAQAARMDWNMIALRWDCRAFGDGKLRSHAFAVRVALAVIKRERQMPGNKFPLAVYKDVYDCAKPDVLWLRHKDIVESGEAKLKLSDRIDINKREFHEAFGQRESSAHETRARHQGIVARRIHEARLDEMQKVLVICRLDRMFQGMNAKLLCMSESPHVEESDRPRYISIHDSLKRDVALLASM